MNEPMQQSIRLKLEDSHGIACDCGSVFFSQSFILRKWSKLLTGTPDDYVEPIPCFRCDDCGQPLKAFFPKGMKDIEDMFGFKEVEETKSSLLLQ